MAKLANTEIYVDDSGIVRKNKSRIGTSFTPQKPVISKSSGRVEKAIPIEPESRNTYTPGYVANPHISKLVWNQIGQQYADQNYSYKETAKWVNKNYAALDKLPADQARKLIHDKVLAFQAEHKQKVGEYTAAMDKHIAGQKDYDLTPKLHSEILGKAQDDARALADKYMASQQEWKQQRTVGDKVIQESWVLAYDPEMEKNTDPKAAHNKGRWIQDPDNPQKWVTNPDWRPVRPMTVAEQNRLKENFYSQTFKDMANQRLAPFGVDWQGKKLKTKDINASNDISGLSDAESRATQFKKNAAGDVVFMNPDTKRWELSSNTQKFKSNVATAPEDQMPTSNALPIGRQPVAAQPEFQEPLTPERINAYSALPTEPTRRTVSPEIAASQGYANPITPEGGTYTPGGPGVLPLENYEEPSASDFDVSAIANGLRSGAASAWNTLKGWAVPQNVQ